jgi:hypothetical protein
MGDKLAQYLFKTEAYGVFKELFELGSRHRSTELAAQIDFPHYSWTQSCSAVEGCNRHDVLHILAYVLQKTWRVAEARTALLAGMPRQAP